MRVWIDRENPLLYHDKNKVLSRIDMEEVDKSEAEEEDIRACGKCYPHIANENRREVPTIGSRHPNFRTRSPYERELYKI